MRATTFTRANFVTETPWQKIVLESSERHLRRKVIMLGNGEEVLVDFERPVKLENRDCLVLENGNLVQIIATDEDLMEVRGRDAAHLTQLAWHIGNRHLEAQIEATRILIRRDHVIEHMLELQGATVRNVTETFEPEHGAYHGH
jgi:urease accessory protein